MPARDDLPRDRSERGQPPVPVSRRVVLNREQVTTLARLVKEWGIHSGSGASVTLTAGEGGVAVRAGERLVVLSLDGRTTELKGVPDADDGGASGTCG